MNKNARKLIPAVAMLLVSASMLSTASFAWFSMNTRVTAAGMKVNVAAPANIMIKKTTDSVWGTDISLAKEDGTSEGILGHATSVDGTTLDVIPPTMTTVAGAIKDDVLAADAIKTFKNDAIDATKYETLYGVAGTLGYVDFSFDLATTSRTDMKVTLDTQKVEGGVNNAIVGASGDKLLPALRFAVLEGSGDAVSANAYDDATKVNGNVWAGTDNTVQTAKAFKDATDKTEDEVNYFKMDKTDYSLFTLPAAATAGAYGATKTITIRVWLEGCDPACVNANILALKEYTISVAFATVA